jgi:hypothetical protein
MNESRISFGEALEFNAAVKFPEKSTGIPADDDSDMHYYTSHRPAKEQLE